MERFVSVALSVNPVSRTRTRSRTGIRGWFFSGAVSSSAAVPPQERRAYQTGAQWERLKITAAPAESEGTVCPATDRQTHGQHAARRHHPAPPEDAGLGLVGGKSVGEVIACTFGRTKHLRGRRALTQRAECCSACCRRAYSS